jgi:RNA polymerase sigma-70 factor (ECF subfamily)
MDEPPTTRSSLLARIRNLQDREAWHQFVEIYAPLVYQFARRRRLQDADAADLTQDVLRAVAGAADRLAYEPRRGSFRGWLYAVARHKLSDFLANRRRPGQGSGDPAAHELLAEQPAREEEGALWDQEYERRLFAWAAERVRGEFRAPTWQAFWLTAVEGKEPREAAATLGMSPGAVYVARSRVLARLRKHIQELQVEGP